MKLKEMTKEQLIELLNNFLAYCIKDVEFDCKDTNGTERHIVLKKGERYIYITEPYGPELIIFPPGHLENNKEEVTIDLYDAGYRMDDLFHNYEEGLISEEDDVNED